MQIIHLNATDNTLIGKYLEGETDIKIICDTSVAGFNVALPDLTTAVNKCFNFYNIPLTSFGKDLTITPVTGQKINVDEFKKTVPPFCHEEFVSDKKTRWLTGCHNTTYKTIADSITLVGGGAPGLTVEDLQTAFDGNIYRIREATGAGGIELIVDFIDVSTFNLVRILGNYDGSATHSLEVQLYHWENASWDVHDSLDGIEKTITAHSIKVFGARNYIGTDENAGKVRVRIYHPQNGNSSHYAYFDEIALYK